MSLGVVVCLLMLLLALLRCFGCGSGGSAVSVAGNIHLSFCGSSHIKGRYTRPPACRVYHPTVVCSAPERLIAKSFETGTVELRTPEEVAPAKETGGHMLPETRVVVPPHKNLCLKTLSPHKTAQTDSPSIRNTSRPGKKASRHQGNLPSKPWHKMVYRSTILLRGTVRMMSHVFVLWYFPVRATTP